MKQEMVTVPKIEYEKLKEIADIDRELIIKLIKGLEDIRHGRIKLWEKVKAAA